MSLIRPRFPHLTRRSVLAGAGACALGALRPATDARAAGADPTFRHAIAMYGEPALPPDFSAMPYVRPDAPKGGRLTLGQQGTFDGMNLLAIRGNAPPALQPYILQTLMFRTLDEPFTLYPLLAESIAVPEDRTSITFRLDPRATFSDGKPVTPADVLFSWDLLKRKGRPFHRLYYSKVKVAEAVGAQDVKFDFGAGGDFELPLILGLMPVFAKHATDPEKFEQMGFTPLMGSGPYTLESVEPGTRLMLKRRADFWAADIPSLRGMFNFDEIRFEYFRDSNTFMEAFRTGLYDYRVELDPSRWVTAYDSPARRDGKYVLEGYEFQTPKPVSGFIFNTRRWPFQDRRVRDALSRLLDFEWLNRNLFRSQYKRTVGYFDESELSSKGRPADERERALLAPFLADIPADVLEGRYLPPKTDGSGRDRAVMGGAVALLKEAGFKLNDGALVDTASGWPLAFDIIVNTREKERIALAFADTLRLVGVRPRIRLVDDAQYWGRLKKFDYDMVIETYGASASPGQEQINRWSSAAAKNEASLNYPGVTSPAVDAMIQALLAARGKSEFVAAVRALDRALISGFYIIPLYHAPQRWVARWARVARPERVPRFDFTPDTWWRSDP